MDPQARQEVSYKAKATLSMLQDKTKIAMKKMKGEYTQELDLAITKATLSDEVVPKEKHVRTLKVACSPSASRPQVDYVIHKLEKRMRKADGWLVTLKCLMVFHRLMRELDHSFQDAFVKYGNRTGHHHVLALDRYADHTTKETWDLSAWIRAYSMYLDERLEVFKTMNFDPEQDEHAESKLKACPAGELLEKLPLIQKLLSRLLACIPEGAAAVNPLVQTSCIWVLKESRSIYKVASEGVINLADKFFDMDRSEAIRGLELYKEGVALSDQLNTYYANVQLNPSLKNAVQFPTLASLPSDFVITMEDYVREAPRTLDPNAQQSRRIADGSLLSNRVSSMAARGGTTSAAFVGGSVASKLLAAPPKPGAHAEEAAPPPPPLPPVDLLGFDDLDLKEQPGSAKAAQAQKKDVFDELGEGMLPAGGGAAAAANGHAQDGFDDSAFPSGSSEEAHQQQQQQQLPTPFGAPPPPGSRMLVPGSMSMPHLGMGMHSQQGVVPPMMVQPPVPFASSASVTGPAYNPFLAGGPPPAPASAASRSGASGTGAGNPFTGAGATFTNLKNDPLNTLTSGIMPPRREGGGVGSGVQATQAQVAMKALKSPRQAH